MAKLKSLLMSTKNRDYDPMSEDGYDSKIPLHTEEAFQHGIHFDAKFIGSMEVPKPTSRAEIVSAMRRIRYEFKAKSVKKRKVNISISVDGIKVSLWKKQKKERSSDDNQIVILQHPIYRVFYVSHDSQDLKIFSFIARDSVSNAFRCNVFKAYKKWNKSIEATCSKLNDNCIDFHQAYNEAMRIVRTIGQAFEVCHKLALQRQTTTTAQTNPTSSSTAIVSTEEENPIKHKNLLSDPSKTKVDSIEKTERYLQSVELASATTTETKPINLFQSHSSSEFTLKHQMQFMQEQLQQMQHESEVAFHQIKLIKEQLNLEIAARIEAQTKNAQLLQRNRELLQHIQQLLLYTNKLELKLSGTTNHLDSMKTLPSRPTDLLLPSLYSSLGASGIASIQAGLSSDSPDSGKGKEISSESISDPFFGTVPDPPLNQSWNRHNSTKTFSIVDDLTIQSISIHETETSLNTTSHAHPDHHHHHGAYSSTSPSLTSSSSSSPEPNRSSQKTDKSKRKTDESAYFEPSATSTMADHHLYHQIANPIGSSSSFTNSAFTQSPHRTAAKEFDPFAK